MRTIRWVVVVIALCAQAACTGTTPPEGSSSPAQSDSGAPTGRVSLDCADPIDVVSSPERPYEGVLDVVGLHLTSTLETHAGDETAPHRLYAKSGLVVRAGQEATLTVPPDWADRVSIGWGTNDREWVTSLHIPACPAPPETSGEWLVFPGGYALDEPACVPLQVRTGNEKTDVHIALGTRCPN